LRLLLLGKLSFFISFKSDALIVLPPAFEFLSLFIVTFNVAAATAAEAATSVKNYSLPPAKSGCKYIDAENAGSLIQLLHEEAKAI
jgi:hypothetical protein